MFKDRSPIKVIIYSLISVAIPMALVLINHLYWIDNILLSLFLVAWMGFSLLMLQPYRSGDYETTEP